MLLDVRLFAVYRERARASVIQLDLPDGATVADLVVAVRRAYPNLAPPHANIVVAVDAEYAEPDLRLRPGAEICLIPPVSGGLHD